MIKNRLKTNKIEQQPVITGIEQAGFFIKKAKPCPACRLYRSYDFIRISGIFSCMFSHMVIHGNNHVYAYPQVTLTPD